MFIPTTFDGPAMAHLPIGMLVHYYSGTPSDYKDRIEVINSREPIEEQIQRPEFNDHRISDIYIYMSKDDAATNPDAFYNELLEVNDGYFIDDLLEDIEFPILDGRWFWMVYEKGGHSTVGKLDGTKPLNTQVQKRKLKNAYLCDNQDDAWQFMACLCTSTTVVLL